MVGLTEPNILTFTCNNCGKQLLSGVQKRENMIIREPKMYCSECYYMAIQQNKQYRIRNELLEKQNREHMLKSKEVRAITLARAKSDNNKNLKQELSVELCSKDYSKDQEGIEE